MRVNVDVDIQKALNRMAKYGRKAEGDVKKAVQTSTYRISSNAKKRAPVDTGNLRGSISSTAKLNDGFTGEIKATAEHAPFVEFGTRKMAAQPYMGPAVEEETPKFNKALKGALKE